MRYTPGRCGKDLSSSAESNSAAWVASLMTVANARTATLFSQSLYLVQQAVAHAPIFVAVFVESDVSVVARLAGDFFQRLRDGARQSLFLIAAERSADFDVDVGHGYLFVEVSG